MTDDVTFPPDTINAGDTTDPNTGATVSGDGSNIVFPDQNLNPQPLPPDMPTFPTPDVAPSPWDTPTPDPANDPIFGPSGAGPDPQGPDF